MQRAAALFVVLAVGCSEDAVDFDPQAVLDVEAAIADYPGVAAIHADVMTNTCSPNPGVCHNSSTDPELHTVGGLLGQIGAPCNANHPDPTLGWDPCERAADSVELGEWTSQLAWLEVQGARRIPARAPRQTASDPWFNIPNGSRG